MGDMLGAAGGDVWGEEPRLPQAENSLQIGDLTRKELQYVLQHTTHDAPRVRGLLELYFDGMVPREVVDNAPDMINHFTTSPYILSELAARREAALQTLPATNEGYLRRVIEQLQVTSKSMNLNGGSCDILLAPFVDEQKEACEITPSVCIDILNNLFLHLDPEACVRKDIVVASLSSLLKIDHDHKCSVMVGCVLHSSGELMMEVEMTGDGLTSTFHILVTDNLQVVQRLLEEYGYRKEKHTIEESFGELDTLDETQDMFSDDEDEDEDDE